MDTLPLPRAYFISFRSLARGEQWLRSTSSKKVLFFGCKLIAATSHRQGRAAPQPLKSTFRLCLSTCSAVRASRYACGGLDSVTAISRPEPHGSSLSFHLPQALFSISPSLCLTFLFLSCIYHTPLSLAMSCRLAALSLRL